MTYSKDNLRQIFQQPFNMSEWQQMLQHYFQAKDLRKDPEPINGTSEDEKGYYLGALDTIDSYRIGLFYYQIQRGNVARKRVGLRNLVKSFVNPNWGEFDAALVVFDSGELWRLSFVSDIKGESTAPKRYTYVFGEGDSFYNTPVGRFDALQRKGISFENIKDAFSVEALSKEFFDEYREHYADIVEYITGKRYVKEKGKWVEKTIHEPCHEIFDQFAAVYKDPEKTVRDYIKKLMGRLVFLQFLQKKGWMGVPSNRQDWKGGDTRFLQNKFNEFADKDNFIDGFLEPLFNDLNTNRQDKGDLASPEVGKDIKIPFLNGGLFQLDEEDCSQIRLPQHLLGDVLDFFERYNFTIDENDPNDAQIGVDPEMLGRVFENLLEDNKDKGAFYTPKEIVQYMCQESLIAYLQTGIDDEADKESIRQFVLTHEAERLRVGDGTSGMHLGSMAEDISIKLLNVKICDPAIGSGAFPMGLLRQLYLCQCAIHPELEEKNAADIKRHIIQNNIYGVDIEKGAVDIARLRFWLSLIVDEETPRFLPNLDFKIMQGNSLLEQYKGVDLSKVTELSTEQGGGTQLTWFDKELDILRFDLREKLNEYYNCSDHQRKEQLKQEIIDNVKQQLREQSINVDFGDLDLSSNDQFTLWHTWFYDVFSQGGFDIVIGNPPYIRPHRMADDEKVILWKSYKVAQQKTDIYAFFIELGCNLLGEGGTLAYITPKTWHSIYSFQKLRELLIHRYNLFQIGILPEKVFYSATVETALLFVRNDKKNSDILFVDVYGNKIISSRSKKSVIDDAMNISIEENMETDSTPLGNLCKMIVGIVSGNDKKYCRYEKLTDLDKPCIRGTNISRYSINYNGEYIWYNPIEMGKDSDAKPKSTLKGGGRQCSPKKPEDFELSQKIVMQRISKKVIAALDTHQYYAHSSVVIIKPCGGYDLKLILAILNSRYVDSWLKKNSSNISINIGTVKKIPIPPVTINQQREIVSLVDKIHDEKREDSSADTSTIEFEIDLLVYHLYGLTYDEVLIVDPETPITREEYEKKQN